VRSEEAGCPVEPCPSYQADHETLMPQRYQGQRPADDPILDALVAAGTKFWAKRGVYFPPGVAVDVADDLRDADTAAAVGGRGYVGGNRLVLDGYNTGVELRRARSKRQSVKYRRKAIQRLGEIVAHELGHVGGIAEHTPDGLMGPEVGRNTPYEVRVASRKLVPKGKGKVRRKPNAPLLYGSVDS
jgi:hypothetical protein